MLIDTIKEEKLNIKILKNLAIVERERERERERATLL